MTIQAAGTPSGCVPLTDWGVIRAQGPDAASFLHGQLTQDITGLSAGHARLAGYCSAKGRLLASFIVWRPEPDTVLLACSADLLAPTLKRLSMFVLRAKAKLTDASADWPLHGLAGEAVAALAPSAPWTTQVQDGRHVLRLPDAEGVARALVAGPVPDVPPLDPAAWSWLETCSAVPRITAATVEQFVPQMVNLELLDGVNFRKGCYPGQEIVARSQYRGTTKRRTFLCSVEAPTAPAQEVFHSGDPSQPAGMVVNAATWQGRHVALVELKLASLDGGTLHLGTPGGPLLARRPMPYDVPLDVTTAA